MLNRESEGNGKADLRVREHFDPIADEKTSGPIYHRFISFYDLREDFLTPSFVGLVHGGEPEAAVSASAREEIGYGVVAGHAAKDLEGGLEGGRGGAEEARLCFC